MGTEITELEYFARLLLSVVLGAAIGLEREKKNQAAGFRTHTILCVGACLVMTISYRVSDGRFDPGRIAAQVVSGIGFLGAGAILRFGANVKGLTTAASIWTVAMVGLAVGAGLYREAVIATGLLFAILYLFSIFQKRLFTSKKGVRSLTLTALDAPGLLGEFTLLLEQHQVVISSIGISRDPSEGKVEIAANLILPPDASAQRVIEGLQSLPGLQELDFQ